MAGWMLSGFLACTVMVVAVPRLVAGTSCRVGVNAVNPCFVRLCVRPYKYSRVRSQILLNEYLSTLKI